MTEVFSRGKMKKIIQMFSVKYGQHFFIRLCKMIETKRWNFQQTLMTNFIKVGNLVKLWIKGKTIDSLNHRLLFPIEKIFRKSRYKIEAKFLESLSDVFRKSSTYEGEIKFLFRWNVFSLWNKKYSSIYITPTHRWPCFTFTYCPRVTYTVYLSTHLFMLNFNFLKKIS